MVACRRNTQGLSNGGIDVCWPPNCFRTSLAVYHRLHDWIAPEAATVLARLPISAESTAKQPSPAGGATSVQPSQVAEATARQPSQSARNTHSSFRLHCSAPTACVLNADLVGTVVSKLREPPAFQPPDPDAVFQLLDPGLAVEVPEAPAVPLPEAPAVPLPEAPAVQLLDPGPSLQLRDPGPEAAIAAVQLPMVGSALGQQVPFGLQSGLTSPISTEVNKNSSTVESSTQNPPAGNYSSLPITRTTPHPSRFIGSSNETGPTPLTRKQSHHSGRSAGSQKRPLDSTSQATSSTLVVPLKSALIETLEVIKFSLKLFGPRRTVVSFNGGKDAVVLLHLFCAVLANLYSEDEEFHHPMAYVFPNSITVPNDSTTTATGVDSGYRTHVRKEEEVEPLYLAPRVICFNSGDEFPEVDAFVKSTSRDLGLDLRIFDGPYQSNIRRCFQSFGADAPQAVLLGLRSSDPNSATQQIFEPSSSWLKNISFLRVHPILRWNYGHIWDFIRRFQLPYCELYNRGFTSLGSCKTTTPNPFLKIPRLEAEKTDITGASTLSQTGEVETNTPKPESSEPAAENVASNDVYLPAFELTDWRLERSGRLDSKKKRKRHKKSRNHLAANDLV